MKFIQFPRQTLSDYTPKTALLAFRHVLLLNTAVLLMEEILHQLVGSLSHCSQGFIHPRWLFGISEPSTVARKPNQLTSLNTNEAQGQSNLDSILHGRKTPSIHLQ